MGLVTGLITFVVGVLVGGVGIYVGAELVGDGGSYEKAVTTAIFGSLVWALVGTFFGWVPLLGPILTFLAYLGVLNVMYEGGWVEAAAIAVVAWLTLVVVFTLLGPLGLGVFSGVGVPGV
ncbi:hypothetical protein I7X12_02465 [Halosimplex litoreum]|uniref:Uncharacterized protein n=1 Tax=Halosimplex litoreum TaxID=1198301 RepID=A0A7T3G086_9EURY|nr:hypothetical protein [Halosimplex litoreum]QPV63518.1 hypothetical protein I7X12_02465 [Halosimplex litoreum]